MSDSMDLRILIIDDNPNIHRDFIKTLTTESSRENLKDMEQSIFGAVVDIPQKLPSFQFDTCTQGREGVKLIEKAMKEARPYALAFVDMRMPPGWDGVETIKHIWAIDKEIQIVICTAYSDYSWEKTVEELGQKDNLLILKKPFDTISVRQLTCALTKKWLLMQDANRYTHALEEGIKERTNTLEKSVSIMRATFESSTDGILVVDKLGNIVDHNDKFIELFAMDESLIQTKLFSKVMEYLYSQIIDSAHFQKEIEKIPKRKSAILPGKISLHNGKIFEYFSQPHKLKNEVSGYVWSFRDITNREILEKKLQYQALHDDLTGLMNRAGLIKHLKNEIHTAKQKGTMLCVLFVDLDRFKLVNDSINHDAGDAVLREISKRLQASIRGNDFVARLGGDEFVVIIPSIADKKYAEEVANNILISVNMPMQINDINVFVTTSIGIAIYPDDAEAVDDLLHSSDIAMYHAKKTGANQYAFYNTELNQKNIQRFEKIAELRSALKNHEFYVCYQPELEMSSNRLIAFEALIRWKHPKKGAILPMEFIPLLEETGMIIQVGEWVLREACRQNKEWQDRGFSPIRIAVNISAPQFIQLNFVSIVKNILQETGLDPKYLELELTENMIINNLIQLDFIKELRELGVQITLDDFGTGYSSLSYLKDITLDRLKIDKSFINDICEKRSDQLIVKAIIGMAQSMSLEVVAEGIERQDQLNTLISYNCNEIQGYYFGKPKIPADAEEYLIPKETKKE